MKTKLVALNLLLLAGISAVAWQAKLRMDEAQAKRRANLNVKAAAAPAASVAAAATPKPDAAAPAKYADVAQKNLFSRDRNPNIVIEPPAEKPKPMPALPVLYGVMGLPSGMRALMSEKPNSGTRPVKAGEKVGEFKVVSLDAQNVVFEWEGQTVARRVDELIDRSARDASAAPQSNGPAAVVVNSAASATSSQQNQQNQQGGTQQTSQNMSGPKGPGVEMGAPGRSERACAPGDSSPDGAVSGGYRKQTLVTPFGSRCSWVPAQ